MPVSYRMAAFYFAFFVWAGFAVAYFPPYLAARGLSAVEIAWVLSLPPLARIVAPALWGWLADRSGALRAIVFVSCAVSALCYAVLPQAGGVAAIAWIVGIGSLFSAAAMPLVEAITLGALAGQSGRYGPIRLWGSIGFIGAVLAGGMWLDFHSVLALPHAIAAFASAAALIGLLLPPRRIHAHADSSKVALSKPALALLASAFWMAVAHGTLYAFLTLHLQSLGYSGTLIGFLWTLGVLAEIVVFLFLPQLFRRHSLAAILMASAALGVVRFVMIGWASQWLVVLFIAQLLHAATFGSFHAAAVAAVHRLFPAAAHARGQALFSSFGYGAGGALGAVSAGWAWAAAGPGFAFTLSSVAAAAGLLFAYPLRRHIH